MATPEDFQRIQVLAYQLWEAEGRPEGRQQHHWSEAERRLHASPPLMSEATPVESAGTPATPEGVVCHGFDREGFERSPAQTQH